MDGTLRLWRWRLRHLSLPQPPASIPAGGSRSPPDSSPSGYPRSDGDPRRCKAPNTIVGLVAAGQSEVAERVESSKSAGVQRIDGDHEEDDDVPLSASSPDSTIGSLIRCKRIYNFLCSMLVLHELLYVLFTLHRIFMHFSELTY
jgi:hypothetical protein